MKLAILVLLGSLTPEFSWVFKLWTIPCLANPAWETSKSIKDTLEKLSALLLSHVGV